MWVRGADGGAEVKNGAGLLITCVLWGCFGGAKGGCRCFWMVL